MSLINADSNYKKGEAIKGDKGSEIQYLCLKPFLWNNYCLMIRVTKSCCVVLLLSFVWNIRVFFVLWQAGSSNSVFVSVGDPDPPWKTNTYSYLLRASFYINFNGIFVGISNIQNSWIFWRGSGEYLTIFW